MTCKETMYKLMAVDKPLKFNTDVPFVWNPIPPNAPTQNIEPKIIKEEKIPEIDIYDSKLISFKRFQGKITKVVTKTNVSLPPKLNNMNFWKSLLSFYFLVL